MQTANETGPNMLPCGPTFRPFPRLPAELQIQIWREATSEPRVVEMLLHTAHDRSQQYVTRRDDPGGSDDFDSGVQRGRLPALLHVSHRAREVGLAIYKHRFRVMGCNEDLWETYVLADHDILCLSDKDVIYLVEKCVLRDQGGGGQSLMDFFDRDDYNAIHQLRAAAREGALDGPTFSALATPRVIALVDHDDSSGSTWTWGFRGDLSTIKTLMVYKSATEQRWPGLVQDPDVLHRFDRGLALFPRTPESFVAEELPPRYHCRPVHCPHHPGTCDRVRPTMTVGVGPLSITQCLKRLTVRYRHWPPFVSDGYRDDYALRTVFAFRYGEPYSIAMWHLSRPDWTSYLSYDPAKPVGATTVAQWKTAAAAAAAQDISARRADQFLVIADGPMEISSILDPHKDLEYTCARLVPPGASVTYFDVPLGSTALQTPGCGACTVWAYWDDEYEETRNWWCLSRWTGWRKVRRRIMALDRRGLFRAFLRRRKQEEDWG